MAQFEVVRPAKDKEKNWKDDLLLHLADASRFTFQPHLLDALVESLERTARLAVIALQASAALVWIRSTPQQVYTVPQNLEWDGEVGDLLRFCVQAALAEAPLRVNPLSHPAFQSFVGVPLLDSAGEVFGSLAVLESGERVWANEDLVLLEEFAHTTQPAWELAVSASQRVEQPQSAVRQRQAQELELLTLARAAVARELDLNAVIRKVVEAATDSFGYRNVSLYLLNDDHLVLQHHVGHPYTPHELPISLGIMGQVARTGIPLLVEDVHADARFVGNREGITSKLTVPLLDQGKTVGVLNVETANDMRLTEADLQLMVALSEHVGIAIERARLYSAVRQQETQYRTVLTNIQEIIFQIDAEGRWSFLNPAWQEITGFTVEETLLKPSIESIHPDDQTVAYDAFHSLEHGLIELAHFEVRCLRKDGGFQWVEAYVSLVTSSDGTYLGAAGVLNDIGKRREAEEAFQRQLRETMVLNRVIAAVASALDPNAIMTIICAELAAAFELEQAAFGLLDEAQTKLTIVAEYVGEGRPSVLGLDLPVTGNRITEYVVAHGMPYVVVDSQTDEGQSVIHDLVKQRGTKSLLIVPVMIRGEVIGTIGLDSLERRDFTPDEVALAQNIANAASQVLEKARLYTAIQQELTERKRAEEMLRQQNQYFAALYETSLGLMNRLELSELLETIVTRATELSNASSGYLFMVNAEADKIELVVGRGATASLIGTRMNKGEGVSGRIWATGEAILVSDYQGWSGRFQEYDGSPFYATMAVPLFSEGKVIGSLGLSHSTPDRTFSHTDLEQLKQFAQLASIAMDNARLYSSVQQELVERKRAEEALRISEERYAVAVRGANDGLWDWNLQTGEVYFSPRWKAMLGFDEHEIGANINEWFSRVHPEEVGQLHLSLAAHLQGKSPQFDTEYRMRLKNNQYRWMRVRSVAVRDVQGIPYRMAGSQTDISDRKRAEQQLLHDASHDALTGLPNRTLFMERLGRAIERSQQNPSYLFGVLFLDLDRFKVVNDSLGHLAGDQLLVMMARRLETCVRPTDLVVRLGGDEFTVLLENIHHIDDATVIADRIQHELTLPFRVAEQDVFISASVGIVLSDAGYEYPVDILRDADIAMYHAKELGKARYMVFDVAMHARAVELLNLETALRHAVERDEFRLNYQPIVSLSSGRITGFEALLRWNHPTRGEISPATFIPVTEETGLIVPIGRWVLREACRQMRDWQLRFPNAEPLTISVNLSSKQLSQDDMVRFIAEVLHETGLPSRTLKLEITESVMMENTESAIVTLNQLRGMGICIDMDDFGSGYSSLAYLHRFPIDTLKIDRVFVNKLGTDQENSEIVQTIATLARSLDIAMVAEGVETLEQLTQLRALGCEFGQGYLFGKPLSAACAETLILEGPSW